MNPLDQLAEPEVLDVHQFSPFLQALKDQKAGKTLKGSVDAFMGGSNAKLTTLQVAEKEAEKRHILEYGDQSLPGPEDQLRDGALALGGNPVAQSPQPVQPGAAHPAQPGFPAPVAAQVEFSDSPETRAARANYQRESANQPKLPYL